MARDKTPKGEATTPPVSSEKQPTQELATVTDTLDKALRGDEKGIFRQRQGERFTVDGIEHEARASTVRLLKKSDYANDTAYQTAGTALKRNDIGPVMGAALADNAFIGRNLRVSKSKKGLRTVSATLVEVKVNDLAESLAAQTGKSIEWARQVIAENTVNPTIEVKAA